MMLWRPPIGTPTRSPRQVTAAGWPEVQVRGIGERVGDGRDLGGIEQQPTVGIVDVHHRTSGEAGGEQRALASK